MTNIVNFPDRAAVEEEAALWLVRLDGGDLAEEQRRQLRAWLAVDPSHPEALRRMAALWGQLDSLAVLAELFPLPAPAAQSPASLSPLVWLRQQPLGASLTFAASAALVVALMLTVVGLPGADRQGIGSPPVELVYDAAVGEQTTAILEDGSTMLLNTGSVARVRFNGVERAVFLDSGEGHFTVAKNPEVPFVVYAGHGMVRAVGTAFSVRLHDRQVDVAVTEGTVEVVADIEVENGKRLAALPWPGKPVNTLTLKERGMANYGEVIEAYTYVDPAVLEKKLAWRRGKWVFEGETLARVVAEANRYTEHKIEIGDPAIADLKVGGYFDVGEVDALLAALQTTLGIRVERGGNNITLLAAGDGALPVVH